MSSCGAVGSGDVLSADALMERAGQRLRGRGGGGGEGAGGEGIINASVCPGLEGIDPG